MTSEVVLIRHSETDWNVARRYQGTSDRPLTELGERQAEALADSMKGEEWDAIISSPLQRAWNTALPIADALGMGSDLLVPDPRLMERDYGVAEGFTIDERLKHYPGDVWEGLESHEDLEQRSVSAIEDYIHRFPNQRLLMVTHGTWINSVLEVLSSGEFGHGKSVILNTSRTFLTRTANGWEVGEVGVADHLSVLV